MRDVAVTIALAVLRGAGETLLGVLFTLVYVAVLAAITAVLLFLAVLAGAVGLSPP